MLDNAAYYLSLARDVHRFLRAEPLADPEAALRQRAGVWLAHDEFKGRRPIVRPGVEIQAGPASFANPRVRGLARGSSSGSSGLSPVLCRAKLGRTNGAWFTPANSSREARQYRLATGGLLLLARLMRAKAPFPVYLEPTDFSPVARWIAEHCRQGVPGVVLGLVSPAARVAVAALENGFLGSAEELLRAAPQGGRDC